MISVVSRRALARAASAISTAVLMLAATGAPVAAQDPRTGAAASGAG